MKYHKTSYKASVEFFFVTFTLGNTQFSTPTVKQPESWLDTNGGSVDMARDTFLRESLLGNYIIYYPATGRRYCFSSLKDRKKNLSYRIKHNGSYVMRRFLSKTDPDFFPVDLLNFQIK